MSRCAVHDITQPIPLTAKTIYTNKDNERSFNLWANVLIRAVQDLYLEFEDSDNSLKWFISNDDAPQSFLWLCSELDINPQALIKKHATRIRTLIFISQL